MKNFTAPISFGALELFVLNLLHGIRIKWYGILEGKLDSKKKLTEIGYQISRNRMWLSI